MDVHVVFKNINHKNSNLSKGMKIHQIPISAILLLPVVMRLQRAVQTTEMSDLFPCSKMDPDLVCYFSFCYFPLYALSISSGYGVWTPMNVHLSQKIFKIIQISRSEITEVHPSIQKMKEGSNKSMRSHG